MAAQNFPRALAEVLKHEGGFVNHPKDPGGATNKGITIGTYRRYINRNGTVDDLRQITDDQVAKVYRKHWWDAVKGDDLLSGIDYAVFDFAVNSGPARAAKYLQAILGVAQDGKIGPITLAAARANATSVINRLCDDRMAFLRRLGTWPTFGRGWTNRVTGVRSTALGMVAGPAPVKPPKPAPAPQPAPEPQQPPKAATERPSARPGLILGIAAVIVAIIAFVILN